MEGEEARSVTAAYGEWLRNTGEDREMQLELAALADDEGELRECFCRELGFGTSGIRGILGPGPNRMNLYVVRRITTGLADYMDRHSLRRRVVIAYDSRRHSRDFAEESARVLCARGIESLIFDGITPVPVLTYAARFLSCAFGIMITASHNPSIYNGYKVYKGSGAQITGPEADEISGLLAGHGYFESLPEAPAEGGKITLLDDSVRKAFINDILQYSVKADREAAGGLRIVYSPLNGAGRDYVPEVLSREGFTDLVPVKAQMDPDPEFTTCKYPNPERVSTYNEAFRTLDAEGGDLIIVTDPDGDRLGAALVHKGMKVMLSGNQTGLLIFSYLLRHRRPPEGAVAVRSIVSTPLFDRMAGERGIRVIRTLTGFKYIGEIIEELEGRGERGRFYYGFEESSGYLTVPFLKDKDGISSALALAGLAAELKAEGRDLMDLLDEISEKYGPLYDKNESFAFEGERGMETISGVMRAFRRLRPGDRLGSSTISRVTDFMHDDTGLPQSDVVAIETVNGDTVTVRPSGTEPKIKTYSFTSERSADLQRAVAKLIKSAAAADK